MVDNYNRRIFKNFVKYLYFILFINFSFFLYIEMANNYNSKIFEGIFRDLFLFFFFISRLEIIMIVEYLKVYLETSLLDILSFLLVFSFLYMYRNNE